MPYQDHFGMSRVLVEAATVATPVAVHANGLLAYLVRTHGLGLAVDCSDAEAFARALEGLTAADAPAARPQALRRFAERYSRAAFERALHAAVAGAPAAPRPRVMTEPA
jgi:glycosyltransferase involved in cell wall biosynthesis